MFHLPEKHRAPELDRSTHGCLGTGNNGWCLLRDPTGRSLAALASDAGGWDHVSVSLVEGKKGRVPNWNEIARFCICGDRRTKRYRPPTR